MISITGLQIQHHQLAVAMADAMADNASVSAALGDLDMQPTSTAWAFAANAALAVLLAHDLGHATTVAVARRVVAEESAP